jgi:hypothetical protein
LASSESHRHDQAGPDRPDPFLRVGIRRVTADSRICDLPGKQRVLDTGGRIDRFKKKYGKKAIVPAASPGEATMSAGKSKRKFR